MVGVEGQEEEISLKFPIFKMETWKLSKYSITLGRLVPCFCKGRCLQVKSYPVLCDARP